MLRFNLNEIVACQPEGSVDMVIDIALISENIHTVETGALAGPNFAGAIDQSNYFDIALLLRLALQRPR